jgi:hypothetical protein
MSTTSYPHPTLPFKKKNLPDVLTGSQVVHDGFVDHAVLLGTPPIALQVFQGQITDVSNANLAMKTNKAAGPARAVKVELLWGTLGAYLLYTDQLCAAHPDQAAAYIAAAGFRASAAYSRNDLPLEARATTVPGQVLLVIHSALLATPKNKPYAKRTILVHHTLDGGKTFVSDDPTSNARTLVSGLPPLVPIGFEVAAKDSSGVSAWCPTVPITLTK